MWTLLCLTISSSSVMLVQSVQLTAYKDTLLDQHNNYRKEEGATNMNKLLWSSTLTGEADAWINSYTGCYMLHQYGSRGENLYASDNYNLADSINGMVGDWFSEKENYTYSDLSCVAGQQCGHYTQVVWADTQYVGCAYKQCGTEYLGACFYAPTGNYEDKKPYKKGTKCSECSGGQTCEDNMCIGLSCRDIGDWCSSNLCSPDKEEDKDIVKKYCQETCNFCPSALP